MKYLGREAPYGIYEKQTLVPDGVLQEFTLIYRCASAPSILIGYNGAVLQPNVEYALTNGGKNVLFNFVPLLGSSLYVVFLGRELAIPAAVGNYPFYSTAVGDGVQETFSVNVPGHPIVVPHALLVFKDGTLLRWGEDWDMTGNDEVTFVDPPADDSQLTFYVTALERSDIMTVDTYGITTDKIAPMAVTADKLNIQYTSYVSEIVLQTFGGMAMLNTVIHAAEYADIGKCIKLRLHLTTTLANAVDNKIRFSLPVPNNGSTNVSGSVTLSSATQLENGIIRWGGLDCLDIYRQFGVNYTNEEWTAEVNMEYESE